MISCCSRRRKTNKQTLFFFFLWHGMKSFFEKKNGTEFFFFSFSLVYYFLFLSYLLLFCSVHFLLSSPPDFDLLEPNQTKPIITFFFCIYHIHTYFEAPFSLLHSLHPSPSRPPLCSLCSLALSFTLSFPPLSLSTPLHSLFIGWSSFLPTLSGPPFLILVSFFLIFFWCVYELWYGVYVMLCYWDIY